MPTAKPTQSTPEQQSPSVPDRAHRRDWREWLTSAPVLLRVTLLLTFLAYLRTVTFDWVFDDHYQVTMNPWLDSWGSLKQIFTLHSWAFSDFTMPAKFYRPMYLVWLLINNQIFHGTPAWFHLAGVGLHLAVVYLAYLTARRLLNDDRIAAVAALIFALHPSKVESVAWVAGLTEVVLAAFFFGTILAYLKWRQAEGRPAKWLVISTACFAGAIFSKETAVLAPALILAYEWNAEGDGKRRIRDLFVLALPYGMVGAGYFLIRLVVMSGVAELGGKLSGVKTIFTIPLAFWWYVQHTVWPFGLSLYYPEMIVRGPNFRWFVVPAITLMLAVIAYIWLTRRSHLMQFLGLWFVLTLAPPIATILLLQPHDRYLYLPTFAFAVMVAVLIGRLRPYAAKAAPVVLALAVVLTLGTYEAARYWESDLKLFTRGLEKAPDNMAVRPLAAAAIAESGDKERALKILLDGFRQHPESVNVSYALGQTYVGLGKQDEARRYFFHTLDIAEDKRVRAMCYFQLGMLAQGEGNPLEAEKYLREAITLTPTSAGFHQALGNILKQTGRADEAKREFEAEQDVRRTRTRNF